MLVPSPKWLDSGNNAWQLAAATFVGLQSIPGLAVLYAGYVKQKWAINSAFMCFYAFASVLVVWVLFDYNMAFGEQWFPFLGKPALATSASFTLGQATIPAAAAGMPELLAIIEGIWLRNGPLVNYQYPNARPTYEGRHRHLDILDALRARDENGVRKGIQQDMIEGGRLLVKVLERLNDGAVTPEELRRAAQNGRLVSAAS